MSFSSSCTPIARDALGIGLRPAHYRSILEGTPALEYVEIISDNFLSDAAQPARVLDQVRARLPVVMHGVGLNLLGHEELDEAYLDAIARLADRLDAPFVSDHLCWTGAHGVRHHDLLPLPYTEALLDFAASRAQYVQARIGRPFAIENLSTYVELRASSLSEPEFYARVVRESGCWFMLDVNNIYVSAVNHAFEARDYLDSIDWRRVLQVHLAGHSRLPDGTRIDTHDRAVCDEVWALYSQAWAVGGPFPTLLEWDARIPPLADLLRQLDRAREVRA